MPKATTERLKSVPVKEEFQVLFEGDAYKSMVMQQMLYWTDRVDTFDQFIEEERARATKSNPPRESNNVQLYNGWVYKSAAQLCEEFFMLPNKQETIRRHLTDLYEEGYLDRRSNPNDSFDKVYQYRVNLPYLRDRLLKVGYILQGYKFDILNVNEMLQNPDKPLMVSKPHFVDSEQHFEGSEPHFVDSYISNTENTTKNTKEREEKKSSLSKDLNEFEEEIKKWAYESFELPMQQINNTILACKDRYGSEWYKNVRVWFNNMLNWGKIKARKPQVQAQERKGLVINQYG